MGPLQHCNGTDWSIPTSTIKEKRLKECVNQLYLKKKRKRNWQKKSNLSRFTWKLLGFSPGILQAALLWLFLLSALFAV